MSSKADEIRWVDSRWPALSEREIAKALDVQQAQVRYARLSHVRTEAEPARLPPGMHEGATFAEVRKAIDACGGLRVPPSLAVQIRELADKHGVQPEEVLRTALEYALKIAQTAEAK